MRLLRALAVVPAAVLLTTGLHGIAWAEDSGSCPEAQSTRLVTGSVLGDPTTETKLWVYSPSSTRTVICFVLPFVTVPGLAPWHGGSGAIVVDAGADVRPPTITPGTNPAACTVPVVDLRDPARLYVATGASGSTVCLTVNGSTTTVGIGMPGVGAVPSVQVWREGSPSTYEGNYLNYAFCGAYELAAIATGDSGLRDQYVQCMTTTTRIV